MTEITPSPGMLRAWVGHNIGTGYLDNAATTNKQKWHKYYLPELLAGFAAIDHVLHNEITLSHLLASKT